ncbi:MAG: hypothetical protein DRQ88_01080 [Epsilonproteobacteria bacterium]|nr:MAG: hypothetical protein DRQ89_05145 [Campylobacterota bacterium]RLA67887.1 MAG: hypothetical protein DRQ88_01080 [Campylobacterota bacterium]
MKLPILLHDEKCSLCKRFKQAFERIPGTSHITFASIYDDEVYLKFPQIDPEMALRELHYLDASGEVYIGKDALSQLMIAFPLVKKISWLIEGNMGQKALSYFNQVAKNYRKRLIKDCNNCK